MFLFRLLSHGHPEQRHPRYEAEGENCPSRTPRVSTGRLTPEMGEKEARRNDAGQCCEGETPGVQSAGPGRAGLSQIASTAFARRLRTSPATAVSSAFSMACIDATGSMALTSTPPSTSRRITLQGSIAPTRGSIPMA